MVVMGAGIAEPREVRDKNMGTLIPSISVGFRMST